MGRVPGIFSVLGGHTAAGSTSGGNGNSSSSSDTSSSGSPVVSVDTSRHSSRTNSCSSLVVLKDGEEEMGLF